MELLPLRALEAMHHVAVLWAQVMMSHGMSRVLIVGLSKQTSSGHHWWRETQPALRVRGVSVQIYVRIPSHRLLHTGFDSRRGSEWLPCSRRCGADRCVGKWKTPPVGIRPQHRGGWRGTGGRCCGQMGG
jgi:hypothetical protein